MNEKFIKQLPEPSTVEEMLIYNFVAAYSAVTSVVVSTGAFAALQSVVAANTIALVPTNTNKVAIILFMKRLPFVDLSHCRHIDFIVFKQ